MLSVLDDGVFDDREGCDKLAVLVKETGVLVLEGLEVITQAALEVDLALTTLRCGDTVTFSAVDLVSITVSAHLALTMRQRI